MYMLVYNSLWYFQPEVFQGMLGDPQGTLIKPYINNMIPLNWLNMSVDTYKLKCKEIFLKM